jgi:hypothetical protein
MDCKGKNDYSSRQSSSLHSITCSSKSQRCRRGNDRFSESNGIGWGYSRDFSVDTCARLGLLLACDPASEGAVKRISPQNREIAIELVKMCGVYADSARFAEAVGIPAKSAVSGVILTPIPDWGAIAVYSPALDAIGNSVAGMYLTLSFSEHFNLRIKTDASG